MPLTGSIKVVIDLEDSRVSDLAVTAKAPLKKEYVWNVASGVGAEQADVLAIDERSVASAATDSLDLTGAATLVNAFGTFPNHIKVKALVVQALPTNTTNITVTRPATNGLTWVSAVSAGIVLGPGDFMMLSRRGAAGIGVTAGTADLVDIVNAAGATATYQIIVIGTSA